MSGAPARILGAILAGGRSRRFGRDKTAEPVAGVSMLERAVRTLSDACDRVIVVSSRPDTPRDGWTIVPDARPGRGPLGGIEAALLHADREGFDAVFVLAADLPLVDAATVGRIVDALGTADAAAAPARDGDPDFEPLCAIYRLTCLPDARTILDGGGGGAARALFERVRGRRIVSERGALLNVNTARDLRRAEERLASEEDDAG